jgi:hypothetical protein
VTSSKIEHAKKLWACSHSNTKKGGKHERQRNLHSATHSSSTDYNNRYIPNMEVKKKK